jgi:hypothetical protein
MYVLNVALHMGLRMPTHFSTMYFISIFIRRKYTVGLCGNKFLLHPVIRQSRHRFVFGWLMKMAYDIEQC